MFLILPTADLIYGQTGNGLKTNKIPLDRHQFYSFDLQEIRNLKSVNLEIISF